MGFEKDFEHAWKPVSDGITAQLMKEKREKNAVTPETAAAALAREKESWNDPLRLQYGFLESMRKKAPACARLFQETLEGFRFAQAPLPPLPGKFPYVAGAVGAAAAGGAAGALLPAEFFLVTVIGRVPAVLLGTAVFGGIGTTLSKTLWQSRAEEARKDCAKPYLDQLQTLHDTLSAICAKADRE